MVLDDLGDTGSVSTTETAPDAEATAERESQRAALAWVPLIGMAALMTRFAAAAAGPIKDPDAWWHLRVGHEFWSGNWTLNNTAPLSSFATEQWTPRDWMPQLAASKFEDWFGLPGVAWLYGATLVTFLICGYFSCRRFGSPLTACLAVALAAFGASGSLSQRPQLVSFVFLFVFVSAWLSSSRDYQPRWWLIPLTWIWAACHGMWYCGVAVGIVVVVGVAFERRANLGQIVRLIAIPFLGLLAAAATPVGPKLLLTLFDTTGMWQFVTEWQPPSFRDVAPACVMLMIFTVVVVWSRAGVSTPWAQIGLLAVATGWTILSARTVALGAVALAPLLAAALQSLIAGSGIQKVWPSERNFIVGVGVVCLAGLAVAVPSTAATPGDVPNSFNNDLEQLPAGTPILNDYVLGGWLHWRHPGLQTVVDGFTDGYTKQALLDYRDATRVAAGWESYVAWTDAQVAVLPADSPLAVALEDRLGWKRTDEDSGYVLLTTEG